MNLAHLFGIARPRGSKAAPPVQRGGRVTSAKSGGKPDDKRDDETMEEFEERRREQRPNETVLEYRERKTRDERLQCDDDEETDSDAQAARMRERARCAAIFGSKAAGSRPDMAAHFAFATDMSRRDAVAALRQIAAGTPPPPSPLLLRRESFCARMDRRHSPQLGNGLAPEAPDANTPDGLARQMLAVAGVPVERKGLRQ